MNTFIWNEVLNVKVHDSLNITKFNPQGVNRQIIPGSYYMMPETMFKSNHLYWSTKQ